MAQTIMDIVYVFRSFEKKDFVLETLCFFSLKSDSIKGAKTV